MQFIFLGIHTPLTGPENQEQICKGDAIIAVKNVLLAPLGSKISFLEAFQMKCSGLEMIKSSLEGRADKYVHTTLAGSLEATMLRQYENQLYDLLATFDGNQEEEEKGKFPSNISGLDRDEITSSIVHLKTIETELSRVPR